jgi:ribosomal-protein-alanine N-acetyltransferase
MAVPCRIRTAREADVPAVAALERRIFSDPWSPESFRHILSDLAIVAESSGQVIGYFFARAAADLGEILNLAVDPDHRRQGIAEALLAEGCVRLRGCGVQTLFLEVRASNEGAQALYRKNGFDEVGRRQGYYRNPREDALVFARR